MRFCEIPNSITNTTNNYDIRTAPLYFVYGGLIYSSSLNNVGNNGYYWASTVVSITHAYNLTFSTGVNPSYNYYRHGGLSIRCVAR